MSTTISFQSKPQNAAVLVVGNKDRLKGSKHLKSLVQNKDALSAVDVVADGKADSVTQYINERAYTIAHLDGKMSRNMGLIRSDLVLELIGKHTPKEGDLHITFLLESQDQAQPTIPAIARAFPLFSKKTGKAAPKDRTVTVSYVVGDKEVQEKSQIEQFGRILDASRLAARLADTPTCYLNTDTYLAEVEALTKKHSSVKKTAIRGEELREKGMGGIWSVGKAAEFPPVMIILEHTPKSDAKNINLSLVGKGIVYDSGGLSIKPTAGMCGMKMDMHGSASAFAAFMALVESEYPGKLSAILCLAENAVGPKSYKNDDIVTCYSGKTVEINNTDAEGRMVLADGVAYATKHLKPTHVVDIATLTGAQLIATGTTFGAVLCNDEEFERDVVKAGKASGDLVFPIVYAPEILVKLFDSKVADLTNSVSDRMNAQSSAAGHFVEQHLDAEYKGKWAHLDMAGPGMGKGNRGTGFGAALLFEIAQSLVR